MLKVLYVGSINLISTVIRKYFVFLSIFSFLFFACFSMLFSCLYVYCWVTLNGIKLEMKANPALKFIRKNLSKTPSGTPGGLSFPTQQEIVKWKQELPYEDNLRMLFFFHVENLVCFPSPEPKVMNRIYHYSFHCRKKKQLKSQSTSLIDHQAALSCENKQIFVSFPHHLQCSVSLGFFVVEFCQCWLQANNSVS